MKKIILSLSILLVLMQACTEKEDPIQTVKDRLVGTWVTRGEYPFCGFCYDSLTFNSDNSVQSIRTSQFDMYSFNRMGDSITFTDGVAYETYKFVLNSNSSLKIEKRGYVGVFGEPKPDLNYIKK